MDILAATGNRNKIAEIRSVAERFGINIVSPHEIQQQKSLSPVPDVDETGTTYRENARLKAKAFSEWADMPALGDDSGLEVTALGGRPGLHSARYAGVGATDDQKIQKLLGELEVQEKFQSENVTREAFFVCSLVLHCRDKTVLTADSRLVGEVLKTSRGNKGFGYDPIIYLPSIGATLAEVDFSITCTKGFRAIALEKLFQQLSI